MTFDFCKILNTKISFDLELKALEILMLITLFIGVVMPLENNMRTGQHFVGICGVLNKGMSGVTLIYILLGFLGYARYGDDVQSTISQNLDINLMWVQIAIIK